MGTFDDDLFDKGLERRKATLGEWELHCRGAIDNGVSLAEIRAICHVVAIYCGVPQAHECLRSARKVLEERGMI